MSTSLDKAITPAEMVKQLGERGIHISERYLRRRARELGACCILGKRMYLFPEDIQTILEASRPEPRTQFRLPKTTTPHLPDGGYEELLVLREKLRRTHEKERATRAGSANSTRKKGVKTP